MNKETKSLEKKAAGEVELTEDLPVYVPATDIFEKDNAILVRCDMPGVQESGLDVTLEDNVLTLTGRQVSKAPEGYDCLLGEYGTGLFRRAFTISPEVDHAKIKATIRNGVLEIELPKKEAVQPRKIKIEPGT